MMQGVHGQQLKKGMGPFESAAGNQTPGSTAAAMDWQLNAEGGSLAKGTGRRLPAAVLVPLPAHPHPQLLQNPVLRAL